MKSTLKLIRIIWVGADVSFTTRILYSRQAQGVDDPILSSGDKIKVFDGENYIPFCPAKAYQNVFIFYPGAPADPYAYAQLCRRIADHGIKTMIIRMPFRQASFGYNKPKELGLFDKKTKSIFLPGISRVAKWPHSL
jgi:hypothetical protein